MTDLQTRTKNNFDFLRLFGAISVVLSHCFPLLGKADLNPFIIITNNQIGFFLVSIFFCISGYLITKSVFSSSSLKNYLWKRLLRVQPLQILLAIISVFFIGTIFTHYPLGDYFYNKETWSFFRNVIPVFGIQYSLPGVFENNLHPKIINGSLWSLVDEERLYLLMGILCIKGKYIKSFFFSCIGLVNILWVCHHLNFFAINYFNGSNVVYQLIFLNSALLYVLKVNFFLWAATIRLGVPIILLLFASLFLPYAHLSIVFVAPLSILTFAHIKCFLNKAGKWGDFSSAIYMFSFPVQQILTTQNYFKESSPYHLFFITMLIVFPISIVSWHYIEKRLLKYKNIIQ